MKLVSYRMSDRTGDTALPGLWEDELGVLDLAGQAARFAGVSDFPSSLLAFIEAGAPAIAVAQSILAQARSRPDLWIPIERIALQAPLAAGREVFCVGRNYRLHIDEGARARGVQPEYPKVPEFFTKPARAVIGPEADILLDGEATRQLDYEVELAIVIGRGGRNIARAEAAAHIFGYTVANDVSARDVQRAHGQWFKGKGMDSYCPLGPCIVTADVFGDPAGHRLTTRVNGALRQDAAASDMLFDCAAIVESLSRGLTLLPGDVILTGTPSGVALGLPGQPWLADGDVLELAVDGIGVLRNRVRQLR